MTHYIQCPSCQRLNRIPDGWTVTTIDLKWALWLCLWCINPEKTKES